MLGTFKVEEHKMITIINERSGYKTRFKNYQSLYSHLDSRQRAKRFNTNRPHQPIDDWFFDFHSYHRVIAFYEFVSTQKRNSGGKIPKLDVLEMSYESSKNPVIIPITPALDIESLLEDWCRKFCEFYGYQLIEVQDDNGILHVKRPQRHSSNFEKALRAMG